VAAATYTDLVTGVAVPGQTTATASALVQPSGVELNQSATINDVESITGAGFQYSADAFSPAIGSFDGFYTPGFPTTAPVTWTSEPQTASGAVKFDKTVYVGSGTSATGTLADTARLTGSDGFTASTRACVDLSASAFVRLTITKQIPDVLRGTESQAFTFQVKDANGIVVATPSLTFAAGETSKSATVNGLVPGTYTVSEDPATGWEPQSDQTVPINLPTCAGAATFKNAVKPAHAAAVKVTDPSGSESGWEMILTGPGTPAGGETVLTDASGSATFTTALEEGSYTITETLRDGWEQIASTGDCEFTVDYPADAAKTYTCTINNRKLGTITVKKVTEPAADPATFTFTGDLAGEIGGGDQIGPKRVSAGTYTTTETVPAGWDLKSISCSDTDSSGSTATATATFAVAAGEDVTCTYTDVKRGSITVKKVTDPAADPATFTFTGDLAGTIGDGEQLGPKPVAPGTYTTTETVPAGWDLKSISCSDTDSTGSTATATATFRVAAGEDVTCTYTDVKRGMAKVIKTVRNTAPSGTQAFTFQLRQGRRRSPLARRSKARTQTRRTAAWSPSRRRWSPGARTSSARS
jgi:hypothetical protein